MVAASTVINAGGQSSRTAHPQAEAQALDLARRAIALRSVSGPGNQTIKVAELFRDALVAGGFASADISITPVDDTAFMVARWHGSDPSLKPLVISGHLDVVEAKAADWQRDPFTPVVENGYLYGRGASDMKFDGALALAAILEMKREGFAPRRDIVIEFSGDEETDMKTSAMIAEQFSNADLVVNIDGGGGTLDETTGKPLYFTWQGAEKTYADFELTVTNPGGHSSQPRADSAISQLARALVKIGAYRFTPELNDISRTYFVKAAQYEKPEIAAAMRAFAANPADKQRDRDARRRSRACRPDRHDVRGDHDVGRPRAERAAAARDRQHQLPHLPRPQARRHRGRTLARDRRSGGARAGCHRRLGRQRCLTDAGRLRERGRSRDGRRLSRRAGLPEHGFGRERQHVVPSPRRAELRGEPGVHQRVRTTSATG